MRMVQVKRCKLDKFGQNLVVAVASFSPTKYRCGVKGKEKKLTLC